MQDQDVVEKSLTQLAHEIINNKSTLIYAADKLHQKAVSETELTPADLICPLTGRAFVEPVMASNGVTYEREALDKYLESKFIGQFSDRTLRPILPDNSPLGNIAVTQDGPFQPYLPNHFVARITQRYSRRLLGGKLSVDADAVGNTPLHCHILMMSNNKETGVYDQHRYQYQEDLSDLCYMVSTIDKQKLNHYNNHGYTPLDFAVRGGLEYTLEILLKNGANKFCETVNTYVNAMPVKGVEQVSSYVKAKLKKFQQATDKVNSQFFITDEHIKNSPNVYVSLFHNVLVQYAHPPLFSMRHHCSKVAKLVKIFKEKWDANENLSYDDCFELFKDKIKEIEDKNGKINRAGTLYGVYLKLAQLNPALKNSTQRDEAKQVAGQDAVPELQPLYFPNYQ